MTATEQRPLPQGVWLALVMLLAALFYLPGVNGPWQHDDFGRITMNPAVTVTELDAAALKRSAASYPERPLAMVSYTVVYALCGDSPACQKAPNIVLHLLTGGALFLFLSLLAGAGRQRRLFTLPVWFPLAVTALWLLHPLHVSTTLYAVQRMTIVATLLSLLALAAWLKARQPELGQRASLLWLLAAILATVVGALFKESALLVPVFIVLLELLLLPTALRARIRQPVLTALVLVLAFAALLALLVSFPPQSLLGSYASREFTPPERLLTEARILMYYLSELLYPLPDRMSLYLDTFTLSQSLFVPATTLWSVLACLGLLTGATALLLRGPSLLGFGILLFFAGHLLESSVYGLILAYEHRNYLPAIGIVIAAYALLAALPQPKKTVPVLMVAIGLLLAWNLRERSLTWASEESLMAHLAAPRWAASSAANVDLARFAARQASLHEAEPLIARMYRRQMLDYFRLAAAASPQNFVPLANLVAQHEAHESRDAEWAQLEHAATHATLDNQAINAVGWLTNCTLLPTCPVDTVRFARVLDLMLANPKTTRHARIMISRYAGSFFTRVYRQPDKGIALAREAAASGRQDAREILIRNLAYLGRTAEARAELAALRADFDLAPATIARLEHALDNPGVAAPSLLPDAPGAL